MVLAGYSCFLHHLQEASYDLAAIWEKSRAVIDEKYLSIR